MAEFVKPFGPWIMVDSVSDELVARVNRGIDRVLADDRTSAKLDWSHQLAGNVYKELLVPFANEAERDWVFAELKPKALRYYETIGIFIRSATAREMRSRGRNDRDFHPQRHG